MIFKIVPDAFLNMQEIPLVDVRSPAEYAQGHIPEAINIPLFDNEERASVGILYKKSGREASILKGLDIVGPKMSEFVKQAQKHAPGHELRIHCWRGGMRSGSMAWLFSTAGFKVHLLIGGYKAYRRYIRNALGKDVQYIVLSGRTGTGKTDILKELSASGQQVLDLEGLAHHKGSSFGAIGEKPQPTTEQFENNLYEVWRKFEHSRPVWLEDESRSIGKDCIPDPLFKKIRSATVVEVDMPAELRIRRLVTDYAKFPKKQLIESVERIWKKLGGQHAQTAVSAIEAGDFETAIDIVLKYYDKTYLYGLGKRDPSKIHTLKTNTADAVQNTRKVLEFCKKEKII